MRKLNLLVFAVVAFGLFSCSSSDVPTKDTSASERTKGFTSSGVIRNGPVPKSTILKFQGSSIFYGAGSRISVYSVVDGSIAPDGSFVHEFPSGDQLLPFLPSVAVDFNRPGCKVALSSMDAKAGFFYSDLFNGSTQLGWIMETSLLPVKPITAPAVGSQSILNFYADRDLSAKGACVLNQAGSNYTVNFDVSLTTGWNKVVITRNSTTENSLSTPSTLPATDWYAIPGF